MDKSGCKKIIAHLLGTKEDGSDVIGVYPLLSNGTCRFIVFDFDNHEKEQRLRTLQIRIMSGIKKWMRLEKCVSLFFILGHSIRSAFFNSISEGGSL